MTVAGADRLQQHRQVDPGHDFLLPFNQQLGTDARFINCDVYSLPEHLDDTFDIVFTSYGTIGWLPDIRKWAAVVSRFLRPGGKFVFAEFHPVVWMLDEGFQEIQYRYFNSEAIVEQSEGTYTDREASINATDVSWNHGLAEVIQALLNEDLRLIQFEEFDYSPYDCFDNLEQVGERRWRIQHLGDKLPMMYTLLMEKY